MGIEPGSETGMDADKGEDKGAEDVSRLPMWLSGMPVERERRLAGIGELGTGKKEMLLLLIRYDARGSTGEM